MMQKYFAVVGVTGFLSLTVAVFTYQKIRQSTGAPTYNKEEMKYRIKGPIPADDNQVIEFVRKVSLHPPSSKPYNLSSRHDKKYFQLSRGETWYYLHVFLRVLFQDENPGFFVEAGALDGEFLSNTLWLERDKGWSGLLVEPDKLGFRYLQYKHRKAWSTNTCLSNKPYPKETIHISWYGNNMYRESRFSWMHRGGNHELGMQFNVSGPTLNTFSEKSYVPVQCFPLATLLSALNITILDFLSLDVQGSEKDILRSFSWELFRIRVMFVEIIDDVFDENFSEFMESKGYALINKNNTDIAYDYVYVRKDEIALMERVHKNVIILDKPKRNKNRYFD